MRCVSPRSMRFPFPGGDQARQQIVWKDALGAFFAPVDGESDALGEESKIDRLLAAAQFVGGKGSESLSQRAILRTHFSARRPHFIVGLVERVVAEKRIQLDWMACVHHLLSELSWQRIQGLARMPSAIREAAWD